MRTHLTTQSTERVTGWSTSELRQTTWALLAKLGAHDRGILTKDLDRADVRAEMRLLPEPFARLQKRLGRTGRTLTVDLPGETQVEIGPEWASYRVSSAVEVWLLSHVDTLLGAQYSEMTTQSDGMGGKIPVAQTRIGEPVIEFRLAGDKALVTATS